MRGTEPAYRAMMRGTELAYRARSRARYTQCTYGTTPCAVLSTRMALQGDLHSDSVEWRWQVTPRTGIAYGAVGCAVLDTVWSIWVACAMRGTELVYGAMRCAFVHGAYELVQYQPTPLLCHALYCDSVCSSIILRRRYNAMLCAVLIQRVQDYKWWECVMILRRFAVAMVSSYPCPMPSPLQTYPCPMPSPRVTYPRPSHPRY
eukprot:1106299-Rhodomonas_salina.1